MQSSKRIFILLFLLPIAGFILGRYSNISDSKVGVSKKSAMHSFYKIKQDSSLNDLQENHEKENKLTTSSQDFEHQDFDEYDHKLKFEESQRNWNDSLEFFFKNNFINNAEDLHKQYIKLKDELKIELDKEWEKIRESTRTGENEYLFNTTYQQDLRRIEIRSKYHRKLRSLLGSKKYDKLQMKIKNCKETQVINAKKNLDYGFCPTF